MTLRQYIETRTDEADGSEVLQRNHRDVSEQQLVPRIIKRNRQAILVDPHVFDYFQRKRQGRRCTCFSIETSPDALCQVCFGTGIVGGYEKFGTTSEWFDTSYPGIRTVNVSLNFADATRPVMFKLVGGATQGYVEFDWRVRPSIQVVDLFQVIARQTGPGTSVVASIQHAKASEFEPLTNTAINKALCHHTAKLRVILRRDHLGLPAPVLSHVYIRYKLCADTTVQMDVPRVTESIALSEYGIFDSFTTLSGWITDEVRKVSTEDWFRRTHDHTFWKAIESQPNKPLLQNTSHDLVLRLIQSYEGYMRFPV